MWTCSASGLVILHPHPTLCCAEQYKSKIEILAKSFYVLINTYAMSIFLNVIMKNQLCWNIESWNKFNSLSPSFNSQRC